MISLTQTSTQSCIIVPQTAVHNRTYRWSAQHKHIQIVSLSQVHNHTYRLSVLHKLVHNRTYRLWALHKLAHNIIQTDFEPFTRTQSNIQIVSLTQTSKQPYILVIILMQIVVHSHTSWWSVLHSILYTIIHTVISLTQTSVHNHTHWW